MKIGIDIDNVISKFNEKLLEEYILHDKDLRNAGIIDNTKYIRDGQIHINLQQNGLKDVI